MDEYYTDDNKLCEWLKQNSSGIYRPSAFAAHRIESLLAERDALRLKLIETAQELNCMIEMANTKLEQNISATDETPPDYFDAQTVHEAMLLANGHNTHDKGE